MLTYKYFRTYGSKTQTEEELRCLCPHPIPNRHAVTPALTLLNDTGPGFYPEYSGRGVVGEEYPSEVQGQRPVGSGDISPEKL